MSSANREEDPLMRNVGRGIALLIIGMVVVLVLVLFFKLISKII